MSSRILLLATFLTAVTAHVGKRHPYGIYPSPSSTTSSSSSSTFASYGGYSSSATVVNTTTSAIQTPTDTLTSATVINTTSSVTSLPADTSTSVFESTTSSSLLTTIVSGPPISWTTNSNGSFVLGTPTASTTGSSSNTIATTTSDAAPRETTCVAVAINNIGADGICGCDYDVYTCLERLSNLSEWSISTTAGSFNGCMKDCDSEPNCYSFTFQISNGSCKMFGGMLNGGDGVVQAPDFISGEVVKGTCTGHCDGS